MTDEEFSIRPMTRDDWPWIQSWYQDEAIDRELGPLDDEWLEHVLTESDGVQLVIEQRQRPAVLVGCVWDANGIEHGITDIAVDPGRRGAGLGRRAIEVTLGWQGHPPSERWIAFVDPENAAAHRFFTAIGWRADGLDDDMHRFSHELVGGTQV